VRVQWNLPLDKQSNSWADSVVNFQLKRLVMGALMCGNCKKIKDTLYGLKVKNSQDMPDCHDFHSDEQCVKYVSCGEPCEKPCSKCLLWTRYGAMTTAHNCFLDRHNSTYLDN